MCPTYSGLQPRRSLALQTRAASDIHNEVDRSPVPDGRQIAIDEYKKRYPRAVHRPVGPTAVYNCHGLTFASRRTQIWVPSEIQKILTEDEYVEVRRDAVIAGDIAVYIDTAGDISHSGIVVEVGSLVGIAIKQIKVLSKWGELHEVIHVDTESPYSGVIKYYRIIK